MDIRRRTNVYDLGFRYQTIRHYCKIAVRCQDICRAPVQFHHASLHTIVKPYPIIYLVGTAKAEHHAGEHITQRALERQTDDDRNGAGSRQQTLDRQVQHVSHDAEKCGEVDEASQDVLQQLAFSWTSLKDQCASQDTDQEPSSPEPPGNR